MKFRKIIIEIHRSGLFLVILGALTLLTFHDIVSSVLGVVSTLYGLVLGFQYTNESFQSCPQEEAP